ncbi:MAG: CPBP family intramembrane metalloprotease [Chitinophagaceae bacterium]|nr:MAG: CPBP family intramembrane metalloprotease [Chitinophagaceae bacterium]
MPQLLLHQRLRRWPLLVALVCWIVFILSVVALVMLFSLFLSRPDRMTYGLIGCIAAVLAIRLVYGAAAIRTLQPNRSSGLKFLGGMLGGILLMAVILFVICSASGLHLVGSPEKFSGWHLVGLTAFIPLALTEEIPFRGPPFTSLQARYGLQWAQLIGALAFALYHLLNGWGLAQSFLGPFVWAYVFGLAAVYGRGLALATGLHAGINIAQSVVGLGMGGGAAFWKLATADGNTAGAAEKGTPAGLVVQLLLFVGALLLTEKWKRSHRAAGHST